MTISIPRHAFRTDNVALTMAPVVAAAQEAVEGMETSEDDRYDALTFTLSAAKWRCLQDPKSDELETWESWVLAMQVGSALSGDGFVALAPLAIACMAYDADMPITVESEYLPEHLLKRTWVGEFAT